MSRAPRVSVGMPVYNGERFLREALDSIVVQTFEDFELVISDNGSNDGTQEICRAYAAKDRRIRYHRNDQNRGATWNFNHVFAVSSGAYFKWAAHDDACAPTFLSRCVEVFDHDASVVLCYAKTTITDEHEGVQNYDLELTTDSPRPQERFRDLVCIPHRCFQIFGLIRSRVLGKTPLLGTFTASDRVLLARLGLAGRFHEILEYLFFSKWHPGSSCRAAHGVALRTAWFDPAKAGQVMFPFWRLYREYFRAVRDARLGRYDRACCYVHLARWLWARSEIERRATSNWMQLGKDLIKAATWPAYVSYASRVSGHSQ